MKTKEKEGKSEKVKNIVLAAVIATLFLIVAIGSSSADEIVWEYNALYQPLDADRLSNGNTLIADAGIGDRAIEVDPDGNIVWEYNTGLDFPPDADRLSNGNTLIADVVINGVIEVNPDGNTVWEFSAGLDLPMDVDRLSNGNTLIVNFNNLHNSNERVIEVDPDGNTVWEFSTGLYGPYDAERLSNGNTLITDQYHHRVIEVEPDGNIVWEYNTGLNYPVDADRLPNGNTLITDRGNDRVIEVVPDGNIVWEYSTGLQYPMRPADADRLPNGNTLITDTDNDRVIEVGTLQLLPDLVISEKLEEWVSQENKTYNITYTVRNRGSVRADASTTGIYIDGVLNTTDDAPELEANASYTGTVGPFTMSGEKETIKVCADENDVVLEEYEENNCLENVFGIDIEITEQSAKWVSLGSKTFNITYTVKNIGTAAAGPSDAGIYIDGVFNRTVSTKALAPNEEDTKTVGPFTMSGESDMIKVCADNNSVIEEIDESNNCLEYLFEYVGCVAEDGTPYICGDTVTKSCTFNGNMECCPATSGLFVGANNIVIDGAGYKISGDVAVTTCPGDEYSPVVTHSGIVNNDGYNGVVVKDVEIENFCTGVVIGPTYLERMMVTCCKIHDCGRSEAITHGIHMVKSCYCNITKNEIYNIAGTGSGCGGGGNGVFMRDHADYNTVTGNRAYDTEKTGIFAKYQCMHNYISYNYATGNPESGINPMCMMSNHNTYEYNNLSNNIGSGYSTGGTGNNLRYNTVHNNLWGGISATSGGNSATNNSACGNGYTDINANICDDNTCGSGCGCEWNCNNLVPVYFDFDGDGRYSNTTENCTCNNTLHVGACCNPGLFNAAHAAVLNASGICWLTPGDDNDDCEFEIPAPPPPPETPKPFVISGWITDINGNAVSNPNVTVENLNTSAKWTARTSEDSNYYRVVTCSDNVSAGNVLEFNATKGTQHNITNYTVTSADVNDGGLFNYNISLEAPAAGEIHNCLELQNMHNNLSGEYYLANDIDCSGFDYGDGKGFMPVGNYSNKFTGTFDGNGYTITNLYINRASTDFVGLFGYTGSGSEIKNVSLEEVAIRGKKYAGGLAGYNRGTISNSYSTGSVSGSDRVGGLVGSNVRGTTEKSYSTGSVNGTNYVGGLVGYNWYGTIRNSYSTGSVNGSSQVGGLAGRSYRSKLTNSYSTGNVSGSSRVGGLVGSNSRRSIRNSYSTGSVSGSNCVGGLVGGNSIPVGPILNCYWDIYRSGQDSCQGCVWGSGGDCTGKNADNSEPDYWYNSSHAPMDNWDFDNIWAIEEGVSYPYLRWQS